MTSIEEPIIYIEEVITVIEKPRTHIEEAMIRIIANNTYNYPNLTRFEAPITHISQTLKNI